MQLVFGIVPGPLNDNLFARAPDDAIAPEPEQIVGSAGVGANHRVRGVRAGRWGPPGLQTLSLRGPAHRPQAGPGRDRGHPQRRHSDLPPGLRRRRGEVSQVVDAMTALRRSPDGARDSRTMLMVGRRTRLETGQGHRRTGPAGPHRQNLLSRHRRGRRPPAFDHGSDALLQLVERQRAALDEHEVGAVGLGRGPRAAQRGPQGRRRAAAASALAGVSPSATTSHVLAGWSHGDRHHASAKAILTSAASAMLTDDGSREEIGQIMRHTPADHRDLRQGRPGRNAAIGPLLAKARPQASERVVNAACPPACPPLRQALGHSLGCDSREKAGAA